MRDSEPRLLARSVQGRMGLTLILGRRVREPHLVHDERGVALRRRREAV